MKYFSTLSRKYLARLSLSLIVLSSMQSTAHANILGWIYDKTTDLAQVISQQFPQNTWHVVTLPVTEDGPSCGNGTPYRFFINLNPDSSNLVVQFEGGGACTDQKSCEGTVAAPPPTDYEKVVSKLKAVNGGGIPKDYLWDVLKSTSAFAAINTPFTDRLGITEKVQTQSWNMVYLPYCTGDFHMGSTEKYYEDGSQAKGRLQHFSGQRNIRAVAKWIRNNLGQPKDLLVTGFSAGSLGATANYPVMRNTLQPTRNSSLLADSGMHIASLKNDKPNTNKFLASEKLDKYYKEWGAYETNGFFAKVYGGMRGFNPTDPSSMYAALSKTYPDDRFGILMFSKDVVISAFKYVDAEVFKDEFKPLSLADLKIAAVKKLASDLETWRTKVIAPLSGNIGYYQPTYRNLMNSHCLTVISFEGTAIEEKSIPGVKTFINHLLNHSNGEAVMREVEKDQESDMSRQLSKVLQVIQVLLDLIAPF
jgi:hypothetical protein